MLFAGSSAETDATLRAMRAHVDDPLDAVRGAMGVAPLDPADAADGAYPDWYHPSA